MDNPELKARTFAAAIRVVRLVESLPNELRTWTLGKQLLRSGTSQAAQYRAACRAQSTRDFISKMKKMEALAVRDEGTALENEFNELTRIALSSVKTARQRLHNPRP